MAADRCARLLSYIRGPQEGMYSIHPHQTSTNLPRNLNRDDLNTQGPDFSRSHSQPTIMSYYLQRIKLATVCREVCDSLWSYADVDRIDYDLVKSMDAKFEGVAHSLPRFLRFDNPIAQLRTEYRDSFTMQMDNQRVMANQMVNTMRCKLHLPFLIRAKHNPTFHFSRTVGLESARRVFQIRRTVIEEEGAFHKSHMKLGGSLIPILGASSKD